jgi:hypothetical protein
MHNLSLSKSSDGIFCLQAELLASVRSESQKANKKGRIRMATVIEISVALWVMIGCIAMEATQLTQYLIE